ncbi:MAG: heavy-metal-associated domain-containing protein, partial [Caldimonas sp.]
EMQTFKFDVKGMSCGGCTSSVQRALSGLDGVQKVDVTLQPGSATVEGDPDRITAHKIESTLAAMGYEAVARA